MYRTASAQLSGRCQLMMMLRPFTRTTHKHTDLRHLSGLFRFQIALSIPRVLCIWSQHLPTKLFEFDWCQWWRWCRWICDQNQNCMLTNMGRPRDTTLLLAECQIIHSHCIATQRSPQSAFWRCLPERYHSRINVCGCLGNYDVIIRIVELMMTGNHIMSSWVGLIYFVIIMKIMAKPTSSLGSPGKL